LILGLCFLSPRTIKPRVVSSVFVRSTIEFALANGWQPAQKGAPFVVQWKDESFVAGEA
jgi:hypothetical protein